MPRGRRPNTPTRPETLHRDLWLQIQAHKAHLRARENRPISDRRACYDYFEVYKGFYLLDGGNRELLARRDLNLTKKRVSHRHLGKTGRFVTQILFASFKINNVRTGLNLFYEANKIYKETPVIRHAWGNMLRAILGQAPDVSTVPSITRPLGWRSTESTR